MHGPYWYWVIIVSLIPFVLERVMPWRPDQETVRPQLSQDIFWFLFNGFAAAFIFKGLYGWTGFHLDRFYLSVTGYTPQTLGMVRDLPFVAQVLIYLLCADFLDWCIHNLLHRVSALWLFHRVHHTIHIMDWIGNYRVHWVETIVYNVLKYLPLALFGADGKVILTVAIISNLFGNLNHANINFSRGPLRYVFNSPCMHIWHHDRKPPVPAGYNFGIVFSMWDWIFDTAYFPPGEVPESLGFSNDRMYPKNLVFRFFTPFLKTPRDRTA